jgi:hypothetical protein
MQGSCADVNSPYKVPVPIDQSAELNQGDPLVNSLLWGSNTFATTTDKACIAVALLHHIPKNIRLKCVDAIMRELKSEARESVNRHEKNYELVPVFLSSSSPLI